MSTTSHVPPLAARSLPHPALRRWLPLTVLLTALFVVGLDFFIVNVALPSTQAELGAGSASVQLWVAGYGVAFGALLVLGGRLGDLHGRRRLFMAGLAVFTAASAACGAAPDATTLVAARIAQGVGAALLSPQILSTVGVVYEGEDRVKAIAAYGLVAGLAAVSGQLIGGVLIDADVAGLGWRSCFLVNVPIGVAALLLAPRLVPESRVSDRRPLDWPGVALVSVGLAALVLPLVEGRELGWPAWTWACLAESAVMLGLFVRRQRRLAAHGGAPLIDPALWAERHFATGALATLAFVLGLASSFFVLALELQGGFGLTPLSSGLVFTTLAAGYFASSLAGPALGARIGDRRALSLGTVILGAGWAVLALTARGVDPTGSVAPLVPGLVAVGVGMGLLFAPLVSVTLATVPAERAGAASSVVTTVQQVGGAMGVALLGIVFYGVLGAGTPADHAEAFSASAWCLAGLAALVGGLVLLLPRGERVEGAA